MTNNFWEEKLIQGYYDKVLKKGLKKNRGLQAAWHHTIFLKSAKEISIDSLHLDIACGPGTFIGNYVNAKSTGIDIAEKQIQYAKKNYSNKGDFYESNIFLDNNYKKKFNVVSSIGLVEFLSEKEIKIFIDDVVENKLKKNGYLILTTPNYNIVMRILGRLVNIFSPLSYESVTITKFNKRNLQTLLDTLGYEYEIKKIVNLGIFLGVLNIGIAVKINDLISKLIKYRYGFILMAKIGKNKSSLSKYE